MHCYILEAIFYTGITICTCGLYIVIDAILTFRSASTIINYQDQDGRIHAQPTPFLNRVTNAEEKRHIIGDTFAKIASDLLIELDARGKKPIYLAQGTCTYTHVISLLALEIFPIQNF